MNRVKQCTSAAFFMVLSFSAAAHPHSFISLQSEPVVKDGLLSGFKMRWTMDEITSSDLLYDAGNAKPGSEVWKKAGGGGDGQRTRPALFQRAVAQRPAGEI